MEEAVMSDPPSPASTYATPRHAASAEDDRRFDASSYAPNATKAANRAHQLIMRVYTLFIDWR